MKKLGVPATPLASALATSSATRSECSLRRSSSEKRSTSSPSASAWRFQVLDRQLLLVGEQLVVHAPEIPLGGGRLGRLGGQLSMGHGRR